MLKLLLLCYAVIKFSGSVKKNKEKQDIADAIFNQKRRNY